MSFYLAIAKAIAIWSSQSDAFDFSRYEEFSCDRVGLSRQRVTLWQVLIWEKKDDAVEPVARKRKTHHSRASTPETQCTTPYSLPPPPYGASMSSRATPTPREPAYTDIEDVALKVDSI